MAKKKTNETETAEKPELKTTSPKVQFVVDDGTGNGWVAASNGKLDLAALLTEPNQKRQIRIKRIDG